MRRRTILSLAILLLVSVLGASAQSSTTLRVSGNVTWDGVGPVSGLPLQWMVMRLGVPFPVYITTLYTSSLGNFQGRYVMYGFPDQSILSGQILIPGEPKGVGVVNFFRGGSGTASFHVPNPVVFVRGAFQPQNQWNAMATTLATMNSPSQWSIHNAPVREITIPNAATSGHVDNARKLAVEIAKYGQAIRKACGSYPASVSYDLVAHSLDGLVARAYIANHTGGTSPDVVRKCITLGSPHLGTVWLETAPPNWPPFLVSPTLVQTRPSWLLSVFPGQLKGGYGNTRFFLAGASTNRNPSEPESIPGWPYSANDDGLVSAFSATYPFAGGAHPVEETAFFPHAHYDLPLKADVIQKVVSWVRKP